MCVHIQSETWDMLAENPLGCTGTAASYERSSKITKFKAALPYGQLKTGQDRLTSRDVPNLACASGARLLLHLLID